jgi:hypothetical protein
MRRTIVISAASALAGLLVGGYLFAGTRRRRSMSLRKWLGGGMNRREVLGLLGAVGMTKVPGLIPWVVLETELTLVVKHPLAEDRVHYVAIPKKDIKNLADLADEDVKYLSDIFAVLQELVRRDRLTNYQVLANGPERQDVAYLHFHLIAR